MAEYIGQAILHTLVAALVVEALLRLWRVGTPDLRLAFRLLVLAVPLLILPVFVLLARVRREQWFEERWALFVGRRWGELEAWGVGLDQLALALLAGLGVSLFLLDLVPFLMARLSGRLPRAEGAAHGSRVVAPELTEVAGAMGLPPPPVLLLDGAAPLILCSGALRPVLALSRGALASLDGPELRAALAHELGHIARRDPLLGWILMTVRALMFFNPVVQVVARAAVQEMEWRADDLAVLATGDPMALAAGLVKLSDAGAARRRSSRHQIPWVSVLTTHPARARAAAIEKRWRRLLDRGSYAETGFGRTRIVLTGVALSLLLFFVV